MSIPFLLDEKPTVVPVGSAGEAVGRCARASLWRRSLELRASGAVGLRWQAVLLCSEFSPEDAEAQIADAEAFIREVETLIAKESGSETG